MTIASEDFRFRYTSTGGTTYPYTNKILDEDDLKVYVDDVLQTISTHYTVSGVGEATGGNVVFLSAPAAGSDVLLTKDGVTMTQDTDYTENGAFPASAHEDALDKLTNLVQKIWDYTRRSVKVAITSTLTDIELPTPEASQLIGWNSAADNLSNYSITDISQVAASDIGVSMVTSADASGVLTILGASEIGASLLAASTAASGLTALSISAFMQTVLDDTASDVARATLGAMSNPMTAAGDIIYGGASSVPTRLAKGTANYALAMNAAGTYPEWGILSNIKYLTRDLAGASATVSYTGIGFKPRVIFLFGHWQGGYMSLGMWTAAAANGAYGGAGGVFSQTGQPMYWTGAGGAQYINTITATADGFDVAWVKVSSPTGAGHVSALCLKI